MPCCEATPEVLPVLSKRPARMMADSGADLRWNRDDCCFTTEAFIACRLLSR